MQYEVELESIEPKTVWVDSASRNRARIDALSSAPKRAGRRYRVVRINARPDQSPQYDRANIGCRQRAMLELMVRHGGEFPPTWHISYTDQTILDTLQRRGLVTQKAGPSGVPIWRVVT